MRCPCCENEMDVHDTVIKTMTRERVSTIWRCSLCADVSEATPPCECEGYYSEDERTGHAEVGDARRWLC